MPEEEFEKQPHRAYLSFCHKCEGNDSILVVAVFDEFLKRFPDSLLLSAIADHLKAHPGPVDLTTVVPRPGHAANMTTEPEWLDDRRRLVWKSEDKTGSVPRLASCAGPQRPCRLQPELLYVLGEFTRLGTACAETFSISTKIGIIVQSSNALVSRIRRTKKQDYERLVELLGEIKRFMIYIDKKIVAERDPYGTGESPAPLDWLKHYLKRRLSPTYDDGLLLPDHAEEFLEALAALNNLNLRDERTSTNKRVDETIFENLTQLEEHGRNICSGLQKLVRSRIASFAIFKEKLAVDGFESLVSTLQALIATSTHNTVLQERVFRSGPWAQ